MVVPYSTLEVCAWSLSLSVCPPCPSTVYDNIYVIVLQRSLPPINPALNTNYPKTLINLSCSMELLTFPVLLKYKIDEAEREK